MEKIDNGHPVQLVSYSRDSIQALGETVFKCCLVGFKTDLLPKIVKKPCPILMNIKIYLVAK